MAPISVFNKNQEIIFKHLDLLPFKSYDEKQLRKIFDENRVLWKIPKAKSFRSFVSFLETSKQLQITFFNKNLGDNKLIYSWNTTDELTVINALKTHSYFSHSTALALNNLTEQLPKTVYLNFEHTKNLPSIDVDLEQESIDHAFSKEQRQSQVFYEYLGRKIFIINGMSTNRLGIIVNQSENTYYSYTDLERTLLDVVVRPVYSGGVFEVLKAFKNAMGKIDFFKLKQYLIELAYKYPYHQAIGFYLEKAGYPIENQEPFLNNMVYDFYLTYNIRSKAYSDKWKIFYPKGM